MGGEFKDGWPKIRQLNHLPCYCYLCWPWSRVSVRLSSSQAHGSSHGQVFLLGETFGHKPVLPLLVAVAFFPSFMRGYCSQ